MSEAMEDATEAAEAPIPISAAGQILLRSIHPEAAAGSTPSGLAGLVKNEDDSRSRGP